MFLLAYLYYPGFVAKSSIKKVPFFNYLSIFNESIFVDRTDKSNTHLTVNFK